MILSPEFLEATKLAAQLKEELDAANEKIATLERAYETMDEYNLEYTKTAVALEVENLELKERVSELTLRESELAEKVELLESENSDLSEEVRTQSNIIATAEKAGEELAAQFLQLEDEYSALESEYKDADAERKAIKEQFATISAFLDTRGIDPNLIDSKSVVNKAEGVPTLSPAVKRYFEIYRSDNPEEKAESFRLYNKNKAEIDAERARRLGSKPDSPAEPAPAVNVSDEDKSIYAEYANMREQLDSVSNSLKFTRSPELNQRYGELKLASRTFYFQHKDSIDRTKAAFQFVTGQSA